LETTPQEAIIRTVLSIVLREILADGSFDTHEKTTLTEVCKVLEIPQPLFYEVSGQIRSQLQADPNSGSLDPQTALRKVQIELSKGYSKEQVGQVMERLRTAFGVPSEAAVITTPPLAPTPTASPQPPPDDPEEAREQQFIHLVEESWGRFDEVERTGWVDDAFLGNIITAHLEHGRFLLDISSDGVAHYLLFSDTNRARFIIRLDHSRAEDFAFARSVGHLTTVTLGYSNAYPDLGKIFQAMKSEFKSSLAGQGRIAGYEDPGVIKVNAEGTFATAETSLLLELKEYVHPDTLDCDRNKLWEHLGAVYQSLQKYLDGIMQ
jgi:hypothetical protein